MAHAHVKALNDMSNKTEYFPGSKKKKKTEYLVDLHLSFSQGSLFPANLKSQQ